MKYGIAGLTLAAIIILSTSCSPPASRAALQDNPKAAPPERPRRVIKSEREWARQLTHAQFLVTRMKHTEAPFTGKYVNNHSSGIYHCVGCDSELFSSKAKFESGTGWPSFWSPISGQAVATQPDYDIGEPRVEVMCSVCGAHLGHVFNDGPPPTGMRFCINSIALKFEKEGAKGSGAKAPAKAKTSKAKPSAAAKKAGAKPAGGAKTATTEPAGSEPRTESKAKSTETSDELPGK